MFLVYILIVIILYFNLDILHKRKSSSTIYYLLDTFNMFQ